MKMKRLLYILILFFLLQVVVGVYVYIAGNFFYNWFSSYGGVCFTQSFNTLLMYFLFPLMSLKYIQNEKPFDSVKMSMPVKGKFLYIIGGICVLMFSSIMMFQQINEQIPIPGFLAEFQTMLDDLQRQSEKTYELLLNVSTPRRLFITIVVAAVIPAVCEELFFRGWLQTQAGRFVNHHIAVWVVALLFAALHLQYKLIIPQLLMGALFGYVFYYTDSLWGSVIIHFVNNCATVVVTYLNYNGVVDFDFTFDNNTITYLFGAVSTIAILFLITLLQKISSNKKSLVGTN